MDDYLKNNPTQTKITNVNPKFCFVCGYKLEKQGIKWLQCTNEDCAEMFFPYFDNKNNQCLMLQDTPFTPKEK